MDLDIGKDSVDEDKVANKVTDDDDDVKDKAKKALKNLSGGLMDDMQQKAVDYKPTPVYHKGGIVKKTGPAIVQKGELIVPTKDVAKVRAAMRNSGAMKDSGMKNPKNSVASSMRSHKTANERGVKIAGPDGRVHDTRVKEYE